MHRLSQSTHVSKFLPQKYILKKPITSVKNSEKGKGLYAEETIEEGQIIDFANGPSLINDAIFSYDMLKPFDEIEDLNDIVNFIDQYCMKISEEVYNSIFCMGGENISVHMWISTKRIEKGQEIVRIYGYQYWIMHYVEEYLKSENFDRKKLKSIRKLMKKEDPGFGIIYSF